MKYKSLSPPPPGGETDINQSRIYEHFVSPLLGRKGRKSPSCQKEQMTGNKPFFPGTRAHSSFPGRGKQEQGGETPLNRIYGAPLEKKYPASQRAEFYILHSGGGTPIKRGAAGSNFLYCGVMTLFFASRDLLRGLGGSAPRRETDAHPPLPTTLTHTIEEHVCEKRGVPPFPLVFLFFPSTFPWARSDFYCSGGGYRTQPDQRTHYCVIA